MNISQEEYSQLIREATDGRFVEGAFGPEGVSLEDTEQNQWAIQRVKQIRENKEDNNG